jgi:hypothetical protein
MIGDGMKIIFLRSDEKEIKQMATYVSQLVKEEVTFVISQDEEHFIVTLTGGY